jgi:hypothetical protein
MSSYEVPEPIINSPFDEPKQHWHIEEGKDPELRPAGGRPCISIATRQQNPTGMSGRMWAL